MKTKKKAKRKVATPKLPKVYWGEFQYTDFVVAMDIEVSRFIIKENEISFDLTTEWVRGSHWRFTGVANGVGNATFVSAPIRGVEIVGRPTGRDGVPVHFEFDIERQSDASVRVEGQMYLPGETHVFAGTLKKFIPPKR